MNTGKAFRTLQLSLTTDEKKIKHAYAQLSKTVHPEENPEEWQVLFEAYQTAMDYANHRDAQSEYLMQAIGARIGAKESEPDIKAGLDENERGEGDFDEELKNLFDDIYSQRPAENKESYDQIKMILMRLQSYEITPAKDSAAVWLIYEIGRMRLHSKMLRELAKLDWAAIPEALKERVVKSFVKDIDRYPYMSPKMKWMPKWNPPIWYRLLLKWKSKKFVKTLRDNYYDGWADQIVDYCRLRYDIVKKPLLVTVGVLAALIGIWSWATFHYLEKYQIPKIMTYTPYEEGYEENDYVSFDLASIDQVDDRQGIRTASYKIGNNRTNIRTYYYCRFVNMTTTNGNHVRGLYYVEDDELGIALDPKTPYGADEFLADLEDKLPNEDGTTNTVYGVMRKVSFETTTPLFSLDNYGSDDAQPQENIDEIIQELDNRTWKVGEPISVPDGLNVYPGVGVYFMIENNMPEEGDVVALDAYRYVVKPMRIPFLIVLVLLEAFFVATLLNKNPYLKYVDYTVPKQ